MTAERLLLLQKIGLYAYTHCQHCMDSVSLKEHVKLHRNNSVGDRKGTGGEKQGGLHKNTFYSSMKFSIHKVGRDYWVQCASQGVFRACLRASLNTDIYIY